MTGTPGLELLLTAVVDLGGDTRMGKIMETAMMPAIT
jgi:hypothetical protein